MATLIKNARILTMDNNFTEYQSADILVEGSKITAIGEDLTVPESSASLQVIDASGKLAMPGLVNGHIHSPGNFMKGALDVRMTTVMPSARTEMSAYAPRIITIKIYPVKIRDI